MHIPWDDVPLFLAVAETGSMSRAARRLMLGQPTVSRRIAELEERIGAVLFERTATGALPTPAAERLLAPAKRMAEAAGEVERAAQGLDDKPHGDVRITAPPGVAFDFVAPFAAKVKKKLPDIRIEVLSRVEYLDLARREADLALRSRAPTHADLVSVASLSFEVGAFASAAYAATLKKRPKLRDIAFVGWPSSLDHLSPNAELREAIPGFRAAFASDDFIVQSRAAEAGLGAIVLADLRYPGSFTSKLVRLEVDLGPHAKSQVHLVAAKSGLGVPRIRAVAELLAAELARVRA
jgi:DNA-binding transcriptional LysR family regulator